MGDNNYETYEYLPASNAESETDQFFVVQEDGTFLTNRQVQYVTQVQDVKEVLQGVQPCTVYDMGSEQFFVDIDNSSEQHQNNSLSTLVTLVRDQDDSTSASDQFILPEGSNLYGNSYLLQQMPSTTSEQMEVDIKVDGVQDTSSQAEDGQIVLINKQSGDFTEVTLTDDQYNVLEQKGWVLLETNGRIYILDTLGLHDITTNDKLIQKLRHKIQDDGDVHVKLGNIKTENPSSANIENIIVENVSDEQSTIELLVDKNLQATGEIAQGNVTFINNHKTAGHKGKSTHQTKPSSKTVVGELEQYIIPDSKAKNESHVQKQSNILKIKTNFIFEDIPDKIVLGKTTAGNNLVVNVEKIGNSNNKISKKNLNKITAEVKPTVYLNDTRMPEWQLFSAIHQYLWEEPRTRWRPNEVLAAQTIISRLLELVDLKSFIMEHDLVITKIVENIGEINESQHENILALLTGRVTQSDGESLQFNIIPDMLHKAIKSADTTTSTVNKATTPQDKTVTKVNYEFLHIHILESRSPDNSEELEHVSVFLNKRNFPLNFSTNIKKRRLSKLFACSACAALFELESDLKDHQETECLQSHDALTIDTDKTKNAGISSTVFGKEKVYSCDNCNAKFSRVGNCRRHMKTHLNRKNADTSDNKNSSDTTSENEEKSSGGMYKCNMCSSSYYHAATLSKHIVMMHIKTKCNTKQESELIVDCHPVLSYD